MPSRRQGKHKSRHRTHTVKPASLAPTWKLTPLPKEETTAPAQDAKSK